MFKYLLISFAIIFLLSRIGGFLFRSLFWMLGMRAVEKQMRHQEQNQRKQSRRNEGHISVDYERGQTSQRNKRSSQGGDYIDIDYEEVK
ncbi:DUF4834 family protein [Cytophagaceae bacterium DM2B3-1]|uniref:DUF4834 family protein n=1 Tax=Xanthocytophaga flava TaxID=3048013 RepID=A0ABT7CFH2_9BACT|nr:DUF4834 family protein [Xanthocytophaga flavus]MDJ1492493.1 DUF4834 family protein [Xanthocytophaga flavus]